MDVRLGERRQRQNTLSVFSHNTSQTINLDATHTKRFALPAPAYFWWEGSKFAVITD
jgi:hypothetical protein